MKARERFALIVPWLFFVAFTIAAAIELFDLTSTVPFLEGKSMGVVLAVGTAIYGYLLLERRSNLELVSEQLEVIEDSVKQGTERVIMTLGGELVLHRGRDTFRDFMTTRFDSAASSIDIVTTATYGRLHSDPAGFGSYLNALTSAARDRGVRVRRVRGVQTPEMVDEIVAEIEEYCGLRFFVRAFPIRVGTIPLLNVMVIDNEEVAVGGIHRDVAEDVLSITTRQPTVVRLVQDYFDALWSSRDVVRLNTRDGVSASAVEELRTSVTEEIRYMGSAPENYLRSAEIVAAATKRVWVASTLTNKYPVPEEEKPDQLARYEAALATLLRERPRVEFCRILQATSEESLDRQLEQARSSLNVANFHLRYVPDRRPAMDCLIRDDDVILIGLMQQEGGQMHDSVIEVRNQEFVNAVANWYRDHLWRYAIAVKDSSGIIESGVEKVRHIIQSRATEITP